MGGGARRINHPRVATVHQPSRFHVGGHRRLDLRERLRVERVDPRALALRDRDGVSGGAQLSVITCHGDLTHGLGVQLYVEGCLGRDLQVTNQAYLGHRDGRVVVGQDP